MSSTPKYRRVLLKVSGEVLMGLLAFGIDIGTVDAIAADAKNAVENGTQLCMVIGGGNIFRGLSAAAKGIEMRHCRLHGKVRHGDERFGDGSGA